MRALLAAGLLLGALPGLTAHPASADGGVPSAPQNLTVAHTPSGALAFAWTPPASQGASPVTSYQVHHDGILVADGPALAFVEQSPSAAGIYTVEASSAAGAGAMAVLVVYLIESGQEPEEVFALLPHSVAIDAFFNVRTVPPCSNAVTVHNNPLWVEAFPEECDPRSWVPQA